MHGTGCSGLVHWDDPEGWDGEGGGRRIQDGEHMYICEFSLDSLPILREYIGLPRKFVRVFP